MIPCFLNRATESLCASRAQSASRDCVCSSLDAARPSIERSFRSFHTWRSLVGWWKGVAPTLADRRVGGPASHAVGAASSGGCGAPFPEPARSRRNCADPRRVKHYTPRHRAQHATVSACTFLFWFQEVCTVDIALICVPGRSHPRLKCRVAGTDLHTAARRSTITYPPST